MSALIAVRGDADRLSEEELNVMCCALLVAGHETTANVINLSLLVLSDHPGDMARLRADPGLIPGAVEELLRWARLGSIANSRATKEDVSIGGVTIPADELVIPIFASANRDSAIFSDPDRFDIARDDAGHLTCRRPGVQEGNGAQQPARAAGSVGRAVTRRTDHAAASEAGPLQSCPRTSQARRPYRSGL
jgi:cytochrome P450